MPYKNEVRHAKELGLRGERKFIWIQCERCEKWKWSNYVRGKVLYPKCRACARTHISEAKGTIQNPILGDIRKGREIDKSSYSLNYIWQACWDCGRQTWVRFACGKPDATQCQSCANARQAWKGGHHKNTGGYIDLWIPSSSFFAPMGVNHKKSLYVLEHRLVMAQHLGRCLLPWEIIHHKNGIKDDNRLENLELLPHGRFHLTDLKTKIYINKLENQVRVLQSKLKSLNEKYGITDEEWSKSH